MVWLGLGGARQVAGSREGVPARALCGEEPNAALSSSDSCLIHTSQSVWERACRKAGLLVCA